MPLGQATQEALAAGRSLREAVEAAIRELHPYELPAIYALPLERVYAMAPGDALDIGDRKLHAVRPVTFDNPMSLGIFDDRTSTLFSVRS